MKISTKGRYGLRAMVDLALNAVEEHISLASVAQRQGVSEIYLEQVFSTLRKSGLVKSVKGAKGGYMLTGIASEITVGRILRALEGNLTIINEESKAAALENGSIQYCVSREVWQKIDEKINGIVDSITLEDLVNEYRKMSEQLPVMYYI